MQRPCQPPLPSSPQPFVVAKASLGAKPRCQMPYRVTHSSLCVSRQFRAQTFVPHFIHLTRPQYPQTSQNDLLGYVSWQVPNASRYDNGGRANNLRNSSSEHHCHPCAGQAAVYSRAAKRVASRHLSSQRRYRACLVWAWRLLCPFCLLQAVLLHWRTDLTRGPSGRGSRLGGSQTSFEIA
jgi:hypothetical protein